MKVLVIDVGGSNVKMVATGPTERRRFRSGTHMTPDRLVAEVQKRTSDWQYDVISLGIPATVDATATRTEPGNLAPGWVGYDFAAAFGCSVRLINDAAMQALGGYAGGRMLFLGLGTGLGSALIADRVIIPLELGGLSYNAKESLADRLSKKGLKRYGKKAWRQAVLEAATALRPVFVADYVLLGGGKADEMNALPDGVRRGAPEDAFTGGFRLWEEEIEPHVREVSNVWRVVR